MNGKQLASSGAFSSPALVRIGRTLCWAVDDVLPFFGKAPGSDAAEGPVLARMRRGRNCARQPRRGYALSAGKAARVRSWRRVFHVASGPRRRSGRQLRGDTGGARECSPSELARGRTGATADAEGYVQRGRRDALSRRDAELDPRCAAARLLESREVMPSAARPRKVEIRIAPRATKVGATRSVAGDSAKTCIFASVDQR